MSSQTEELLPLPDDESREWKELDGFHNEGILEGNLKEYLSSDLEEDSGQEPVR